MNKIYSTVWSKALGQIVVASELAKAGKKGSKATTKSRATRPMRRRGVAIAVATALVGGLGFSAGALADFDVKNGTDTVTIDTDNNAATLEFASNDDNILIALSSSGPKLTFALAPEVDVTTSLTVGNNLILEKDKLSFANGGPSITNTGIQAGGQKITGVADGADTNDAVNYGQLQAVKSTAEAGWKVKVGNNSETTIATNDTLTLKAGNNAEVTQNGKTITIGTSMTPSFTSLSTTGDVTIGGTLKAQGGLDVASGQTIDMGGNRVTHIADGTANDDAASYGQLSAIGDKTDTLGADVATSLGGGANYNSATGKIEQPTYTITTGNGTKDIHNVGAALALMNGQGNNGGIATGIKYFHAHSTEDDSQAIGKDSIAIGPETIVESTDGLAAGHGAVVDTDSDAAMALGKDASVGKNSTSAIAIGDKADVTDVASHGIAVGTEAQATAEDAVALGHGAVADSSAVALGTITSAAGANAVGAGTNAKADADNALAMGNGAQALTHDSISLGTNAGKGTVYKTPDDGKRHSHIAIGENAGQNVKGNESIAIGVGAGSGVKNDYNVAIGSQAGTRIDGERNVALGYKANEQAAEVGIDHATAIGGLTQAQSNAVALGYTAEADNGGVSIGEGSGADSHGVAIGQGAQANGGFVALGQNSIATSNDVTGAGYLTGTGFSGSAVSVGNSSTDLYRRITNVADGAQDHDAVTVAQLKALKDDLGSFTPTSGGNANYNSDGTLSVADAVTDGEAVNLGQMNQAISDSGVEYFSVDPNGDTSNQDNAGASGANSMAIGHAAQTQGESSLSVGHNARVTESDRATSLGYATNAKADNSTAIGSESTVDDEAGVAIGRTAYSRGENSLAMGTDAQTGEKNSGGATSDNAIALGTSSRATDDDASALGHGATASGEKSTAIGFEAFAEQAESAFAMGTDAHADASNAHAAGTHSVASAGNAFAAGTRATASGTDSIASGTDAKANTDNAIAMGHGAESGFAGDPANNVPATTNTITIGNGDSTVYGQGSLAVGNDNHVGAKDASDPDNIVMAGNNAGAFGSHNTIQRDNNFVVGNDNTITDEGVENTFVLGNHVTPSQGNSVVLGNKSADREATAETGDTFNGIKYSYAGPGSAEQGVVSVGSEDGGERQIINVAAGAINEDSTDAVNGSQLHATDVALGNLANSTKAILGGNAKLADDGTLTTSSIGGTDKDTIDEAIPASRTKIKKGTNVASVNKNEVDGHFEYTIDAEGASVSNTDGNLTVKKKSPDTNNVTDYEIALADDIKVKSVTAGDSTLDTSGLTVDDGTNTSTYGADGLAITGGPSVTSAGIDAGNEKITNVASGLDGQPLASATKTNAANIGDLQTVAGDLTSKGFGLTDVGNTDVTRDLGKTIKIYDPDGNIVTTADATNHELKLSLSDDIKLGDNTDPGAAGASNGGGSGTGDAGVGLNGSDGSIGITGKDGSGADITVVQGAPGLDGNDLNNGDNKTRIEYTKPDGNTEQVATLNDGLKFAGDTGDTVSRKLNSTLNITGGQNDPNKLSTGDNIGVIGTNPDTLEVKLAKNLTLGDQTSAGSINLGTTDASGDLDTNQPHSTLDDSGLTVSDGSDNNTVIGSTQVVTGGSNPVTVDGDTGTVGGLANTTWDPNNVIPDQAASEGQLHDLNDLINKTGLNFKGDDGQVVHRDLGDTLNISGGESDATKLASGNNIGVVANGNNDGVNIQLAKNLTGLESVEVGGIQVNGDGDDTIDGLSNTTFDPDNFTSGQAATEDQLKVVSDTANAGWTVADAHSHSTNIGPDGKVTFGGDSNISVEESGSNNEGEIAVALNKDITVDSVTTGDSTLDTNGLTIANGPEFTRSNISAGNQQIHDVTAGTAGTDAVNVSQLGGVTDALGGGAGVDSNGDIIAPTYNLPDADNPGDTKDYDNVGDALTGLYQSGLNFKGDDGTVVHRDLGDTLNISGGESDATKLSGGDNIGVVANSHGDGVDIQLAKHLKDLESAEVGGIRVNGDGDDTIDGLSNTTFDPDNFTSGQAATEDQLKTVSNIANAGWNVSTNGKTANSTNVGPGDTVDFSNTDANIVVAHNGTNVTVDLADDITVDSVTADSVTTGNSTLDTNGLTVDDGTNSTTYGADGMTIAGGPSVTTSGIDAGGKKITHVAAGTEGGDAVNLDQLNEATSSMADDITQKGMNFAGNEGDDVHRDLGDTLAIRGEATTVGDYSGANVKTTTSDGAVNIEIAESPKFGDVTINDGGSGKITGVADGDIAKGSTDAVNGDQIYQLQQTANAGWNLLVDGKDGSKVAPADNVNFESSDGNIRITKSDKGGTHDLDFRLSKDVVIDNSLTVGGNTKITGNGLTIKNGPSITGKGVDAGGKRITHVAPGVEADDAVTVGQVNNALNGISSDIDSLHKDINRVGRNAYAGIASAMAMGGLGQAYEPGQSSGSLGYGTYHGQSAMALGVSTITDSGRYMFKLSASENEQGHYGVSTSATVFW